MRDLSEFSTFPFELPVTVRALDPPVPLEPAREGENGVDCRLCRMPDEEVRHAGEQVARTLSAGTGIEQP